MKLPSKQEKGREKIKSENYKESIRDLAKASTHSPKLYDTHSDNCTSMDFFRNSDLKTNIEISEELKKEKNNCQSCQ